MKHHHIWMIIGCVLPLLLIFLLPLIGAGGGELLFVFMIVCFGFHLLMMASHRKKGNGDDASRKGEDNHGSP